MTTATSITLEDLIRAHDQRLYQLRQEIRTAEDEISIHEALIALARNHRLVAAVEGLDDKQAQTSQFATDPQEYCTQQGILLPEGVTLNPLATSGSSARMTASLRRAGREVQVYWDSKTGFSAFGHILAAAQILEPNQSVEFPTYAAPKLTYLTVETTTPAGQQGTVRIIAGDATQELSTESNGGQQTTQGYWAGINIGITNTAGPGGTTVQVWTN